MTESAETYLEPLLPYMKLDNGMVYIEEIDCYRHVYHEFVRAKDAIPSYFERHPYGGRYYIDLPPSMMDRLSDREFNKG